MNDRSVLNPPILDERFLEHLKVRLEIRHHSRGVNGYIKGHSGTELATARNVTPCGVFMQGRNAIRFERDMAALANVTVPKVFPEYTSRRVRVPRVQFVTAPHRLFIDFPDGVEVCFYAEGNPVLYLLVIFIRLRRASHATLAERVLCQA